MIYYLPLEPYQERYTMQLKDWTETAFKRNGAEFTTVVPKIDWSPLNISTKGPLDYWRRTRFALEQMSKLIELIKNKSLSCDDSIYFQDMFHPGIESLPYIFDQINIHPRVYVQNCAQSMDVYDFTHDMIQWMRPYEKMVDGFVSGVFVASSIHLELMRAAEFIAPVKIVGLPFDSNEVRSRVGELKPLRLRKKRIVFTSRWDSEKQPHWFMDLIEIAKARGLPYEFCLLQGGPLKSNDESAVSRAYELSRKGLLTLHLNLSKNLYYELLADSQLHFNCALQDFVSNTLNEASALGTPSLVPCFRSFPESVNNNADQMYIAWSHEDALKKINLLMENNIEWDVSYPAKRSDDCLNLVIKELVQNENL